MGLVATLIYKKIIQSCRRKITVEKVFLGERRRPLWVFGGVQVPITTVGSDPRFLQIRGRTQVGPKYPPPLDQLDLPGHTTDVIYNSFHLRTFSTTTKRPTPPPPPYYRVLPLPQDSYRYTLYRPLPCHIYDLNQTPLNRLNQIESGMYRNVRHCLLLHSPEQMKIMIEMKCLPDQRSLTLLNYTYVLIYCFVIISNIIHIFYYE